MNTMAGLKAMSMAFALLGSSAVLGSMYDVTMPLYSSTCHNGCLPWAEASKQPGLKLTQAQIDGMFIEGSAGAASAGAACAMPGASAGAHEKDCGLHCDANGTVSN